MAGYIPWYGKKRARLKKVEQDLISLLRQPTHSSAIAEAAEKLRAAQIRALKARRDYLAPSEKNTVAFQNRDREIAEWKNRSAEEIIQIYRQCSA